MGLIIMTQTRAAWVGTFVILATYALFINRRYLIVFPLLPLLIFIPAVGDRLADLERGTAYTGGNGKQSRCNQPLSLGGSSCGRAHLRM